jgi:hypothetical protein
VREREREREERERERERERKREREREKPSSVGRSVGRSDTIHAYPFTVLSRRQLFEDIKLFLSHSFSLFYAPYPLFSDSPTSPFLFSRLMFAAAAAAALFFRLIRKRKKKSVKRSRQHFSTKRERAGDAGGAASAAATWRNVSNVHLTSFEQREEKGRHSPTELEGISF